MKSCQTPISKIVGYVMGVGLPLVMLGAIPAAAAPCRVPSSAYPTIQAAVNDPSSPPCATINVAAGTYTENVVINRDVTILGEGQESTIVDGSHSGTVFTITSGTVTIKGVTIQNGSGFNVGGIFNGGTLTVQNSTISGNGGFIGTGGIFNFEGTLTVQNSTISGSFGSGIDNNGGTVTVQDSTISDNSNPFSDGGGILNESGTLTVQNSTISGNSTNSNGGGIFNGGTLIVQDSTIADNSAVLDGGGIYNVGTVTLTDVTFQNNTPNDCTGCP